MLDKTSDIAIAAEGWLAEFESAVAALDEGALKKSFHPDSYWRDALALSWTLQTVNGRDDILKTLKAQAPSAAPSGFVVDPDRAAPRVVVLAEDPGRSRAAMAVDVASRSASCAFEHRMASCCWPPDRCGPSSE